jgi:transposase
MLRLEGFVEIQVLQRQGKSIRAISAELGIARNTVRKYLRHAGAPKMKQRPPRPSKLDPFREYLEQRIQAALPDRIPSSVLEREIAELTVAKHSRLAASTGSELRTFVSHELVNRWRVRRLIGLVGTFRLTYDGACPAS